VGENQPSGAHQRQEFHQIDGIAGLVGVNE